jgi:predicted secreted Zn-dependent protease
MIRLLLPSGKVLFTSVQSKIKSALDKGAKKITKKQSDKLLKMDKGVGTKVVGKFMQKDEKTMQVPMASKKQMKKIREEISESVRDFMSKKKKKGGVVTYKRGGFIYAIKE